jgi:hypothetical protein
MTITFDAQVSLALRKELRTILVRDPPLRGFDLDPSAARARSVSRILPLADDAFEAEAITRSEQGTGIREALAEADQVAFGASNA